MMHSPLQRYPEFCRKLLYEGASPEFLEATSEWEKAYGKVGSTGSRTLMSASGSQEDM